MKGKEWDNPNKMHIETGNKEFDRKTTIITTGNVVAPTQYSVHIRPKNTPTNPIGEPVELGSMRQWDLDHFPGGIPKEVKCSLLAQTENEGRILYQFHTNYGYSKQVVHGFVVTSREHKCKGIFNQTGRYSSELVLRGVIPYITEG